MIYKEIENIEALKILISEKKEINYFAFQNIDLNAVKTEILTIKFNECLFLGCNLDIDLIGYLNSTNLIFPSLDVPFVTYPAKLYDYKTLFEGFELGKQNSYLNSYDYKVYNHYLSTGKEAFSIYESLARRLHDHSITDALSDFLKKYNEKKVVAIMGGHSLPRDAKNFIKIAKLSKTLTEKGYLMCSGGGPGAMEATHVGAWFAGRTEQEIDEAVLELSKAPNYTNHNWLEVAMQVIQKYPKLPNYESLGIPTWFYGHEPPTPFASKIAKYFENSIREEGLLMLAKGGIIYTPGAAGTLQEIFQDAAQNHYKNAGYESPMIFYGINFWNVEMPVYPLLKSLQEKGKYKNLILSLTDSLHEVLHELEKFSTININTTHLYE